MIHCKWCKNDKAETDFYKSDIRKGGYGKCKDCVCAAVQKNRKINVEYYQEYERGRASLEHRVKARKEYAKTVNGSKALSRGKSAYYYRYPKRSFARTSVQNAVRVGDLIKPDYCEGCNNKTRLEGHHSDYNKPLDVIWFCDPCHKKWHRENTPIYCD